MTLAAHPGPSAGTCTPSGISGHISPRKIRPPTRQSTVCPISRSRECPHSAVCSARWPSCAPSICCLRVSGNAFRNAAHHSLNRTIVLGSARMLANESLESIAEVLGKCLEVPPQDQLIDAGAAPQVRRQDRGRKHDVIVGVGRYVADTRLADFDFAGTNEEQPSRQPAVTDDKEIAARKSSTSASIAA